MKSKVLSILLLLSTLSSYSYTDVRKLDSNQIPYSLTKNPDSIEVQLTVPNMIEDKIVLKTSFDGDEVTIEGHSKTSTNNPYDKHPEYSEEFRTAFEKIIALKELLGYTVRQNARNAVYKSENSKEAKKVGIFFSYKSNILRITIPTQETTVTQN